MKKIWLLLALIGTVVPYFYIAPFFLENGMNISLFLELLFANSVSRFFAVDLIISSVVFLLWSFLYSRKNNIGGWWMILIANMTVGLSLALPLYFFKRHSSLDQSIK